MGDQEREISGQKKKRKCRASVNPHISGQRYVWLREGVRVLEKGRGPIYTCSVLSG